MYYIHTKSKLLKYIHVYSFNGKVLLQICHEHWLWLQVCSCYYKYFVPTIITYMYLCVFVVKTMFCSVSW